MPTLRNRQRILVVGSGGAGKSTFSRALAARLGLPVIHLDRHYWRPGWQATPDDEWDRVVAELAARDRWIMDGNYGGSLAIRIPRCDAVVFFDFPRLPCLWGVVKRRLATGTRVRPDMGEGCPERLTFEFLRWILNYPRASRPRIAAALATVGPDVQVVTVSNRRAVERVLLGCDVETARSSP
jgi:adenylate kinase family enzyme